MKAKETIAPAAGFLLFILWLIYLADTGRGSLLFSLAKAIPHGDKAGHLLLFGPLTLAMNAAFRFRKIQLPGICSCYLGTLLTASFVLAEELSQHFFPTRTVELLDLLADGTGICLFTWIYVKADRNAARQRALPDAVKPGFWTR